MTRPCTRRLSLVAASTAFNAPVLRAPAASRSSAVQMASVDDMIGKYSIKGTVYDPLDLASKYDINWLREAELKCARSSVSKA
jgi:hypothetical protein